MYSFKVMVDLYEIQSGNLSSASESSSLFLKPLYWE